MFRKTSYLSGDNGKSTGNRIDLPGYKHESVTTLDGRELRSLRTLGKIVSAYAFLTKHNAVEPTMKEVAKVAGCSLRSIYERVTDAPSLRRTVLDWAIDEAGSKTSLGLQGLDRESYLRLAIRSRVETFENWGPLWLLICRYQNEPDMHLRVIRWRNALYADALNALCRRTFSGQGLPFDRWMKLADATASLENWQYLRHVEQLSVDSLCAQWHWALTFLLESAEARHHRPDGEGPHQDQARG